MVGGYLWGCDPLLEPDWGTGESEASTKATPTPGCSPEAPFHL